MEKDISIFNVGNFICMSQTGIGQFKLTLSM